MEILKKTRTFIQELDEKELATYLIAALTAIFLVVSLTIIFYFRRVTNLRKQIVYVNEKREEIKTILNKYEKVEQQQKAVDQLLEENKNFKIRGYFEDLLATLNLKDKKTSDLEATKTEQDNRYIEITLKASLGAMNMKQTCELLDKLEQNKIIYTKELEIAKSKKRPKTVDVMITIATLQPTERTE